MPDDSLTEFYATYGDAELQDLGATFGDLTDAAQLALTAEFGRRGLAMSSAKVGAGTGVSKGNAEGSALEGFAAAAPEDCVFEFTDLEDALLAQSVLKSAGIESLVPSSEIVAIDVPRVIVAPADAQPARLILSRPNALGTLTAEEAMFAGLTCPQCGAVDPVLESVDPTNEWLCEACGHLWRETEPGEDSELS